MFLLKYVYDKCKIECVGEKGGKRRRRNIGMFQIVQGSEKVDQVEEKMKELDELQEGEKQMWEKVGEGGR